MQKCGVEHLNGACLFRYVAGLDHNTAVDRITVLCVNKLQAFDIVFHGTTAALAFPVVDKRASIGRGRIRMFSSDHHIVFGISRMNREGLRRHLHPVHHLFLCKICRISLYLDAVCPVNFNRFFIMDIDTYIAHDLHRCVMNHLFS